MSTCVTVLYSTTIFPILFFNLTQTIFFPLPSLSNNRTSSKATLSPPTCFDMPGIQLLFEVNDLRSRSSPVRGTVTYRVALVNESA